MQRCLWPVQHSPAGKTRRCCSSRPIQAQSHSRRPMHVSMSSGRAFPAVQASRLLVEATDGHAVGDNSPRASWRLVSGSGALWRVASARCSASPEASIHAARKAGRGVVPRVVPRGLGFTSSGALLRSQKPYKQNFPLLTSVACYFSAVQTQPYWRPSLQLHVTDTRSLHAAAQAQAHAPQGTDVAVCQCLTCIDELVECQRDGPRLLEVKRLEAVRRTPCAGTESALWDAALPSQRRAAHAGRAGRLCCPKHDTVSTLH